MDRRLPSLDDAAIEVVRDTIYRTMGDTEGWGDALRAVAHMVGATGVVVELPTFDASKEYAIDSIVLNVDFSRAQEYAESTKTLDPWTVGALQRFPMKPGLVITGQQMTSRESVLKSHWLTPVVIPAEMGDVLTATLEPPPNSNVPLMMAVFHRHGPCEPFEPEAARRLRLVQKDLSRAAKFALLMNRWRERERLLSRALSAVAEAVFILTRHGMIKHCNASAERLMRDNRSTFGSREGRLHVPVEINGMSFLELLARTSSEKRGFDFSVQLRGRAPLLVSLAPLPSEAIHETQVSDGNCIMIVSDPQAKVASADAIRSAFQLTVAEARIAHALLSNLTVSDIAVSQGVSTTTIRSHLKSMFIKLDVNRQSELVKVLGSLKQPRQ